MMKIQKILYDGDFEKQVIKLPSAIQKKLEKTRKMFLDNAFHPSLRLHKLSGKLDGHWSISLDVKYRIIFRVLENGHVVFISVGTHQIYN